MAYFVLYPEGLEEITHGPEAHHVISERGDRVVDAAKGMAPVLTGVGRASLHQEVGDDGDVYTNILWGPEAYYLYWNELGSGHQPARPFLRPALAAAG